MLIVGHSSVIIFRQLGIRPYPIPEKIVISWVGALKIGQFYKKHPAGAKVRKLFNEECGWKFLCIGVHDFLELCTYASMGKVVDRFEEAFESTINSYEEVFTELNKSGKFGCLIFPSPVHMVPLRNLAVKDIVGIEKRFIGRIEELCSKLGVAVIYPLQKFIGPEGIVQREYLQQDGIHVNFNGAKPYIEGIEQVTGKNLFFRPDAVIFESASETESFCSLFMGEMQIPANAGETPQVAGKILVEFAAKYLEHMGIAAEVGCGTRLLSTGLVDKGFFDNLCGYASELLGAPDPEDAHWKGLDTIGEVVDKLSRLKRGVTGEAYGMLSQQDFFTSLNGNYDDIEQRKSILRADEKISNMSDDLFAKMHEVVPINSRETLLSYGAVSFWYALNYARRENYAEALRLLNCTGHLLVLPNGKPGKIAFPFASSRIEKYKREWEKRIEDKLPLWRRISSLLHGKLFTPIIQFTLYLVYYRFLLRIWCLMSRVIGKVKRYFGGMA